MLKAVLQQPVKTSTPINNSGQRNKLAEQKEVFTDPQVFNHASPSFSFGKIPLYAPPVKVQKKLAVNQPGDEYEQEADALADKIMHKPVDNKIDTKPTPVSSLQCKLQTGEEKEEPEEEKENDEEPLQSVIIRKFTAQEEEKELADSHTEISNAVIQTVQSSGQPLDKDTRSFMENRFGYDFGKIRIHDNSLAHQSAKDINALAYSYKNNIVFGNGHYRPQLIEGKKLLAHELTHTIQQTTSNENILQRKGDKTRKPSKPGKPKAAPVDTTPKDTKYHFLVRVPRVMTREEWISLIETQLFRKHVNVPWNGKGIDADKLLTSEDVGKDIPVSIDRELYRQQLKDPNITDEGVVYVIGGPGKSVLDQEIEARFSTATGIAVGDTNSKGEWQDSLRDTLRQNLLGEKNYMEDLPPSFMKVVDFNQYVYNDYEQLLSIYHKLSTLTAEEVEDYLSKITEDTANLALIEASVDRYIAEKAGRKDSENNFQTTKAKLYGLDETFRLYAMYKAAEREAFDVMAQNVSAMNSMSMMTSDSDFGGMNMPTPMVPMLDIRQAEKDLLENLKQVNIPGVTTIADFANLVDTYEKQFLGKTKTIAFDALTRYEHILFEAEKKYSDQANMDALYASLAGPRQHVSNIIHLIINQPGPVEDIYEAFTDPVGRAKRFSDYSKQVTQEQKLVDQGIDSVSAANPIFNNKDFKKEELTSAADSAALQKYILSYIKARQSDIKDTRANIEKDPLLLYQLDSLMTEVYKIEHMDKNSIYAQIIQFQKQERKFDKLAIMQATLVFSLALGVVTLGGGWIGLAAAGASVALSSHQALEELDKYNAEMAAYGAQLLSEAPSKGWVIVSFVAAGIDLVSFSASTFKLIAEAAKGMEGAADSASAIAKFKAELDQIPGLDERLKQALIRGAEAEAKLPGLTQEYDEALQAFRKLGGRTYSGVDPELIYRFAKLAFLRLKKGRVSFDIFLSELRAKSLLTGLEDADHLLALKQGYIQALGEETRLAGIKIIGGRLPINAEEFAGRTFLFDLKQNPALSERIAASADSAAAREAQMAELARKYPNGVKFSAAGFPDFSPYTIKLPNGRMAVFKFKTAGNRATDFAAADAWAGITDEMRQTNGWVWHHVEDAETLILIPKDVHDAVKHSGGISIFKNTVIDE